MATTGWPEQARCRPAASIGRPARSPATFRPDAAVLGFAQAAPEAASMHADLAGRRRSCAAFFNGPPKQNYQFCFITKARCHASNDAVEPVADVAAWHLEIIQ
jgi:hypothetical protein